MSHRHPEKQYLDLNRRIINEGVWVNAARNGARCLTVINADLEYDVESGKLPLVTTRESPWKLAIAELLGYIKGYTNAADFAKLGAKSWLSNANENESWLCNPNRKGENDMGLVYGAIAKTWPKHDGTTIDLIEKVYNDLKNGIDDRAEIINFMDPGRYELGCLRPCLYKHHFSLLDGTLHLNSEQRSMDTPLGGVANMVQCFVLLKLFAQITGHKPGKAYHKVINAHIYENQLENMKMQVEREIIHEPAEILINPDIKTLQDVIDWVTVDDFKVVGYESQEPIKYEFTV